MRKCDWYPPDHWTKRLRVGDVCKTPSGDLRVVRYASYSNSPGRRASYVFAIRACSWTGRPYTVINDNDIRQRNWTLLAHGVRLESRIDNLLLADHYSGCHLMKCCDAKGMP